MYLPESAENISRSIAEIWTAFECDEGDNRTDHLPMMDSIAWPIGWRVREYENWMLK